MTHREIATHLGISHTMVQKIERKALAKLREAIDGEWQEPQPNHYEEMELRGE